MKDGLSGISRRSFVKSAAAAAAATSAFPYFVTGAESNKPLRVGLVGCGGRGKGAANNAMDADPDVKVVALADLYQNQIDSAKEALKKKTEIADDMCFTGPDAYKKLLATDIDYVIFATPPNYRPLHFAEAIKAGKHVFMEKPVAVDPVGIRRMLAAGKEADSKQLAVVAGTQRRHQKGYVETMKKIHDGVIGKIVAAQCYWNSGQLWYKLRQDGWDDMEWMHRDWVNWRWLSGDHIVEQHVHNLDVVCWAIGTHPVKVVSMGSRQRRVTGDQFDNFASDFEFPNNVHVLSQCRQINGCANDVSERVIGEKGVSNCNGWISTEGNTDYKGATDPYVQEHKDLIAAIRNGERLNETETVAYSTMCAIMARESAYTGKAVTWDEMMKSDLELAPPDYELTPENIRKHIAVPGTDEPKKKKA